MKYYFYVADVIYSANYTGCSSGCVAVDSHATPAEAFNEVVARISKECECSSIRVKKFERVN